MPVPAAAMPSGGVGKLAGETRDDIISPIDGESPSVAEEEDDDDPSLLKKRWKQFKKLPPKYRISILVGLILIVPILFNAEDNTGGDKVRVQRDKNGKRIKTYSQLNKKQKSSSEILIRRSGKLERTRTTIK